jgi:hypothetical protein
LISIDERKAYGRGEAWAWWTLLVSNTIALVSATRYDWIVNAIGPFELTEYLGLVLVYIALAMTVPFVTVRRVVVAALRLRSGQAGS